MTTPDFTIGIEEEYLLVDPDTLALAELEEGMIDAFKAELASQVSPEFLKCQIEIGTRVCGNIAEARDDLRRLREGVRKVAERHRMTPIAASCHPFSQWTDLHNTDRLRYNQLRADLAGVVRRLLICGMHVHVGLGDDTLRADMMGQMVYFLPHLLALSASSPFWRGEDTGLASYRLSIFDTLPRTGLPPDVSSWEEYERTVNSLVHLGLIEDSSKIWWDLRPSSRFPTLESRICDVQPRLEHTLALAAATQSLARFLWRLKGNNQRWRRYDNMLIEENRWRAQRYGVNGGLIDFGRREIVPMTELIDELIGLIEEDAEALGALSQLDHLRQIAANGTSADRQRAVAKAEADKGGDQRTQMEAVVRHLIDEFSQDL